MSNTQQVPSITVANVATISRLHTSVRNPEWLATRSREQLWTYVRATAQTLARLGQHGLAADVRLPKAKVESMLWTIFKTAKAAHVAAKAAAKQAEADQQDRLLAEAEVERYTAALKEQGPTSEERAYEAWVLETDDRANYYPLFI